MAVARRVGIALIPAAVLLAIYSRNSSRDAGEPAFHCSSAGNGSSTGAFVHAGGVYVPSQDEWMQRLWRGGYGAPAEFKSCVAGLLERSLGPKAASGRAPAFMMIGPMDLSDDSNDIGDAVLGLMAARWATRIIFVEANPLVLPSLRRNARRLSADDPSRVQVVHAAACLDGGETVTFYTYREELFDDYPLLNRSVFYQLSSLSREAIEMTHKGVFSNPAYAVAYSSEEYMSMVSYIDKVSVPCLTPSELLERGSLDPGDLDALIIDTEGYDSGLVSAFLALDGFAPRYLQFEYHVELHLRSYPYVEGTLGPLINALAARGYEVHQVAQDVVGLTTR